MGYVYRCLRLLFILWYKILSITKSFVATSIFALCVSFFAPVCIINNVFWIFLLILFFSCCFPVVAVIPFIFFIVFSEDIFEINILLHWICKCLSQTFLGLRLSSIFSFDFEFGANLTGQCGTFSTKRSVFSKKSVFCWSSSTCMVPLRLVRVYGAICSDLSVKLEDKNIHLQW